MAAYVAAQLLGAITGADRCRCAVVAARGLFSRSKPAAARHEVSAPDRGVGA
jgi:hypothetical protein